MASKLADIYTELRVKHRDVVMSQYDMKNGAEFTIDKESLIVKKKNYPEKFARHFIKKLREITKGDGL